MIIDFHTHTFPDKIAAKTVRHLAGVSHTLPFTDGSVKDLLKSMDKSGVDISLNLPVATSPSQVEKVNRNLIRDFVPFSADVNINPAHIPADYNDARLCAGKSPARIISLGCMHPDYVDYRKELAFLKSHGIPGIKLHPAYQDTDLDDIRMMRIIDAASELNMIVLVHAGIDIGIPDHDFASVAHILRVIRDIQPPKFVLAHMGGWACWDDVERDLAGALVWMDTSFSIGPITRLPGDPVPPILSSNLSDEAFLRLCRKHGTDRILFATDCPWADQEDYVARINALPFSEHEKSRIFGENAAELLEL